MSSLFPYPGSKSKIADTIIRYLPKHECFVEVFGGSAAVLLVKPRSSIEVYNDLDGDIVKFLLALRQAGEYRPVQNKLEWLCRFTPMSRELYNDWNKKWKRGLRPYDHIESAAVWYFLIVCSVNGIGGWRHGDIADPSTTWQSHVNKLSSVAAKFLNIQIECMDFAYIIEHYDSPDTCFYLDPPYLGVDRVNSYYKNAPPMTEKRHIEMANMLNNIKGKAIVSYYPYPILDKLYPSDKWQRMTIDVPKSSQGVKEDIIKDRGTELLLFNYEPSPLFAYAEKIVVAKNGIE